MTVSVVIGKSDEAIPKRLPKEIEFAIYTALSDKNNTVYAQILVEQ